MHGVTAGGIEINRNFNAAPAAVFAGSLFPFTNPRSKLVYMTEVPNWKHRREHIEHRSQRKGETEPDVLEDWANEAYLDPEAVEFVPDYASRSGTSVRTIGWSDQAGFIITIITVRDSHGHLWGATAFKANTLDERHYLSTEEEQ